jgi:hypothetical protein
MPPWELTYSNCAFAPSAIARYADAGPLNG